MTGMSETWRGGAQRFCVCMGLRALESLIVGTCWALCRRGQVCGTLALVNDRVGVREMCREMWRFCKSFYIPRLACLLVFGISFVSRTISLDTYILVMPGLCWNEATTNILSMLSQKRRQGAEFDHVAFIPDE